MRLEGLKVLVVGLGKSGQAAIELLVEKGAHPQGTDSRPLAELPGAGPLLDKLGVGFELQRPEVFLGWDLIVLSPGVPADLPEINEARRRGTRVIGELELAAPYLQGPKIGITGSNGKTTTTAMVGHILKTCGIACQVGGNIGWAPAAMIASSRPDQWNVLELSSFQLETIETFRAEIAVCLNVTPDHLDRHHSFEAYAAAKRRLFETQDEAGWAVLNADCQTTASFAGRLRSRVVWFSLKQRLERGLWLEDDRVTADGTALLKTSDIPLLGRHNVENTLAAVAAARLAGASPEGILEGVKTFPGVEHRIEFVREVGGVKYYNDSKATNVDATLKAIDAFEGRLWVILGGKDKGSDYRPLAGPLRQKARGVLLIGAAAAKIASQIAGSAPLFDCGTLAEALRCASRNAQPGDVVLLAPACASFDQFQNYEERGKMFKTLVANIVDIGAPAASPAPVGDTRWRNS